jgi:hypothetical protein
MSRAKIDPARSGAYMHGGTGTALLEIEVRDDQQGEKKQGVYDEQHAEAGVSPGEVGDAVRNQSNTKTKIGKLLYFERDIRYQKRQYFAVVSSILKYFGNPRWTNAPSGPLEKGK